jgi:hypothetical protein
MTGRTCTLMVTLLRLSSLCTFMVPHGGQLHAG